ncbi:hypothetical protein dsx2_2516 [Desulfovibrio sp. X2]|uniref:phage regulatory CII family protein n=1 Tax=Desulfovibrio sp. X2 TaxID=941449 RepID=UPI0003588E8F|nr:phage regulatory CII family protein [Desulfovibrio sp. X2]EPR43156.1 hypothetical protein dsx2_2516 [Desulfovibrio sp. X2]
MTEHDSRPLHHLDACDAFKLAVEQSGLTLPQIASRLGWSESMTRRVFSAEKFFPSYPDLPSFCAAVGNLTIVHWLLARATFYGIDENHQDVDCNMLLRRVNDIFAEVGDVADEARSAVADDILEPSELRRLIKEISDVLERGMALLGDLRTMERAHA